MLPYYLICVIDFLLNFINYFFLLKNCVSVVGECDMKLLLKYFLSLTKLMLQLGPLCHHGAFRRFWVRSPFSRKNECCSHKDGWVVLSTGLGNCLVCSVLFVLPGVPPALSCASMSQNSLRSLTETRKMQTPCLWISQSLNCETKPASSI